MKKVTVKASRIEPLTHRDANAKTYRRSREVESQIIEAVSLPENILRKRVAIEGHTTPGHFKEECGAFEEFPEPGTLRFCIGRKVEYDGDALRQERTNVWPKRIP